MGKHEVRALSDLNLQVNRGEFVAIMSPFGSSARARIMTLSDRFREEAARYLVLVFFFHVS